MLAHSGGWSPDVSLLRSRHKKQFTDMNSWMDNDRAILKISNEFLFSNKRQQILRYTSGADADGRLQNQKNFVSTFLCSQISNGFKFQMSTSIYHQHSNFIIKFQMDSKTITIWLTWRDEKNERWKTQTCIIYIWWIQNNFLNEIWTVFVFKWLTMCSFDFMISRCPKRRCPKNADYND